MRRRWSPVCVSPAVNLTEQAREPATVEQLEPENEPEPLTTLQDAEPVGADLVPGLPSEIVAVHVAAVPGAVGPGVHDVATVVVRLATEIARVCCAVAPTPLVALRVTLYVPLVAAPAEPDRTPVPALNVSPAGSDPVRVNVGVGYPRVVTWNESGTPIVAAAVAGLVNPGASRTASVNGWSTTTPASDPRKVIA